MALKLSDLTKAYPPNTQPRSTLTTQTPQARSESLALTAAKQSAVGKVNSFLQRHKIQPFKTWPELESVSKLTVPLNFAALPVTYATLKDFGKFYVEETAARIERAIAANKVEQQKQDSAAKPRDLPSGEQVDDKGLLPFNLPEPTFTRIPRQRKAYTQIVRELGLGGTGKDFATPSSNAALVPLPAGEGKTAIAAMLIKRYQEHNYYGTQILPINNIFYVTPKRAREQTRRFLVDAGVKEVGVKVIVCSYSELRSQKWRNAFKEVPGINPIDGESFVTYKYNFAPMYPALVIIDECHKIKKPDTKTSKLVNALLDGGATRVLFMSATAAVVVNDLYNFAISSRKKWDGVPISKQNWREVAWSIARADPRKPNGEAMKRFGEFFGDAIVIPPSDPCKVKCYNGVKLIRFDNDKDRAFYNDAEAKYFDACERLGKIVNERMALLVLFTEYRKAEEWIKAPYFAKLAVEAWSQGRAPIIAVNFLETAKRVFEFITRSTNPATGSNFTRSDISVIWGGAEIIAESETMSMPEWTRYTTVINEHPDGPNEGIKALGKKLAATYRKTTKYLNQRWASNSTEAEQRESVAWLKANKLNAQNEIEQQEEVDRFQRGDTTICIFTLPAGGTGINLDQRRDDIRPRTMFSTICYYVEEFVQAFGRDYRKPTTKSDVYNYAVFFEDTLVANHTAPKLSKKLESVNAWAATGVDLEKDLVDAVVKGKITRQLELTNKNELEKLVEADSIDEDALDNDDEDDND